MYCLIKQMCINIKATFVQLPEQSLAAMSWVKVELSATCKYGEGVKYINQTVISRD